MELEIITKFNQDYPKLDFTYSEEFFYFQQKRYLLDSGLMKIREDGQDVCMVPVNFNQHSLFSPHKDFAIPYFLNNKRVDWNEVVKRLQKKGFKKIELSYRKDDLLEGFKKTPLSTFVLNLSESQDGLKLMDLFNKKTRNEVKKSLKYDFDYKILPVNEQSLGIFYNLYVKNMQRHGTPAKPKLFFEDLFFCFKNKILITSIFYKGELGGINLSIVEGDNLRLVYNLSEKKFWSYCVNNLLYFKTIEEAADRGIKKIDFGPSVRKDITHNRFKLGFGAKEIQIVKLTSMSWSLALKCLLEQKLFNLKLRINKFFLKKV